MLFCGIWSGLKCTYEVNSLPPSKSRGWGSVYINISCPLIEVENTSKWQLGFSWGKVFREVCKCVSKSKLSHSPRHTQCLLSICQCCRDTASDPVWQHALNFVDVVIKNFINVKYYFANMAWRKLNPGSKKSLKRQVRNPKCQRVGLVKLLSLFSA